MSRSDEGRPLEVFTLEYTDRKALRGESKLAKINKRLYLVNIGETRVLLILLVGVQHQLHMVILLG